MRCQVPKGFPARRQFVPLLTAKIALFQPNFEILEHERHEDVTSLEDCLPVGLWRLNIYRGRLALQTAQVPALSYSCAVHFCQISSSPSIFWINSLLPSTLGIWLGSTGNTRRKIVPCGVALRASILPP